VLLCRHPGISGKISVIEVIGADGTQEHNAALELRTMIAEAWPQAVRAHGQNVRIVANAKCHGQRVRDIDLLLFVSLDPGITFEPLAPFPDAAGQLQRPAEVRVDSLCAVIEIKDSSGSNVNFAGTTVEVRYGDRWKNATEQNDRQMDSVRNYLQFHAITAPRIVPVLWMRNVLREQIPAKLHNVVGAGPTWNTFLNAVLQTEQARFRRGAWVMQAAMDPQALLEAGSFFAQDVQPTELDRNRMELVNARSMNLAGMVDNAGKKLVLVRGLGGTGKTMHLLQLARRVSEDEGARALILTYNKALVADIRRLLSLLGVPDDIIGKTVQIQTVHSFMYSVLRGLGLISEGYKTFLEDYSSLKVQALKYVQGNAVSPEDLADVIESDWETFQWDYLLIDEAQDWPDDERDLVFKLYGPDRIVVAEGRDQLVRGSTRANWQAGISANKRRVVPLARSLRMKSGLTRFVSAFSRHLEVPMEWELTQEAPGGRVIVVEGTYLRSRNLHERLVTSNARDGNRPVDMLVCVPPRLAPHAPGTPVEASIPARVFEQWSYRAWDGAVEDVRESYPTSSEEIRIVQYDSCRGLEGWTVINLGLDDFYQYKLETFKVDPSDDPGAFTDDPMVARRNAARWTLIPMTRAMDTLVVEIGKHGSPVRDALKAASGECPETVEWISIT
jgi:AAA domain